VTQQVAHIFATARDEFTGSVTVRVVVVTGVALGMVFTAVELLWQPHLADLISDRDTHGVAFGALAAASMLAAAAGAWLSPRVKSRAGLRSGYVLALVLGAVSVALLGVPATVAMFVPLYLLAYLSLGLTDPLHFELLNDSVGATARATLISAEALATQGGALVANLAVGALASAHGTAFVWGIAGTLLTVTTLAVAVPLYRTARTAAA
jgi:MFS family permease